MSNTNNAGENTSANNSSTNNTGKAQKELCFDAGWQDSLVNPAFYKAFFEYLGECPESWVEILDETIYCTAQYGTMVEKAGSGDVKIPVDVSSTLFYLLNIKRAFEAGIKNLKRIEFENRDENNKAA